MVIYRGDKDSGCVAIIFDDGPNPEYTPKILDVLETKNVKATFFLIGKNVEKYRNVGKRIVDDGHIIGNHTYTHLKLRDILTESTDSNALQTARQKVLSEIVKGAESIKGVLGITNTQLRYLRPPSLNWNEELGVMASAMYSSRIIMTPVTSEDWSWDYVNSSADESVINIKVEEIVNSAKSVGPGDIIALHDGSEKGLAEHGSQSNWEKRAIPTYRALPRIIDIIKNKGLKIVALNEMNLMEEPLKKL